jgi:hypothetical protein
MWADIEHYGLTALEPGRQFVPADHLDAVPLAEVGAGEAFQPGYMLGRQIPHRYPQFGHSVTGQPVENAGPVTAGRHQARPGHRPQVMGGVRHALVDLSGDLLHWALTLGQQIGYLHPPPARQRLRDFGEGVEQRVLSSPVSHGHNDRALKRTCQIFI